METRPCRRLPRVLRACRHTGAGLVHALRVERAFQEEVIVLLVVALPGAVLFGRTGLDRVLMVGSWVLVLIVELLNTAVERVVDRIGSEHHELSGHAKDLGSAAVGLSIALAVGVWAFLLLG